MFISEKFCNFLRAFSSFSVQNLTRQRYINAVDVVRENKPHISTVKTKSAFLMLNENPGKSQFPAKHTTLLVITYLGAAVRNETYYIIKKKWIRESSKYIQSCWKMT